MKIGLSAGYWNTAELRALGFASVGDNVSISKATEIVRPENISLGDHVRIDAFCSLIATGPIALGRYIHVGAGCILSGRGGITMKDFSGLSGGVCLYSASDDYSGRAMTNPMVPAELTGVRAAPITLGRHVIIGASSVILPGVEISEGSAVGAVSLVPRSLPAWGVFSGNPARRVSERRRDLLDLEQTLAA